MDSNKNNEASSHPLATVCSTTKLQSITDNMNKIECHQQDDIDIQNETFSVDADEKKQQITPASSPPPPPIDQMSMENDRIEENNTSHDYIRILEQTEYMIVALQNKLRDQKNRYYTERIEEEKKRLFTNASLGPDLQTRIELLIDLIEARAENMKQGTEKVLPYITGVLDDYDLDDDDDNDDDDDDDDDDDADGDEGIAA